jgi:hypothetical protein
VIEDVQVCSACSAPIPKDMKFCGECGHKVGDESKTTPVETQEEVVEAKEVKEVSDEKPAEEEASDDNYDFSDVNPATDWECYGQIEPDHTECKKCAFREPCAKESGVKL